MSPFQWFPDRKLRSSLEQNQIHFQEFSSSRLVVPLPQQKTLSLFPLEKSELPRPRSLFQYDLSSFLRIRIRFVIVTSIPSQHDATHYRQERSYDAHNQSITDQQIIPRIPLQLTFIIDFNRSPFHAQLLLSLNSVIELMIFFGLPCFFVWWGELKSIG